MPGHVGVRDRQLRLVDRHRPRRHPDLGDPAAAQAGLADLDQPVRRGDDAVRRGLRRAVPAACTWAGPGSSTGCCPIPTRWRSGRSGAARWSGTSSPSRRTPRSRCLFWYVGLIPDLATLRDRAENQLGADRLRRSWRWAGAARRGTGTATRRPTCSWPAWPRRWSSRCTRSSASTSRSGIVPGWHSTIFPPYFVAGAIYSGFAMVLTLAIPLRTVFGLEDFITMRHLENMAKVMLATADRRLRLPDGDVHRLVQREHLRAVQ